MNRRDFMQAMALSASGLIPIGRDAWAAGVGNPSFTQRKLIVILLRGAVDGLNVVIPYGDENYYRLRPTIAVARPGQENGAIDLDGYFGLHPALASLQDLWRRTVAERVSG